jgi:transposase-like protein
MVKALSADIGISKFELSRICADLDAEVAAFWDRTLMGTAFPYATFCKARVNHRVVSQAAVVATGVAADGHWEVLGLAVGDSDSPPGGDEALSHRRRSGLV